MLTVVIESRVEDGSEGRVMVLEGRRGRLLTSALYVKFSID